MVNAFYQNVLASEVVGELQQYAINATYQTVEQMHGGMLYQSVSAHRLPYRHEAERHIVRSMMAINNEHFKYELFGTFEIQFLKYTTGGMYDWHCDYGVSEHEKGPRKLSLSIQLSNCWDYNGGEVVINDWYNRENYMDNQVGAVMVFDSRVPHKVMPVTDGERYAIVAWAHGPQLR